MRPSGKTSAERLRSASHWALIPLVAGILIGMGISTVLLLQPQDAITNVYLELPSEREDVTSRLSDLRRMMNELGATRRAEVEKLAEEVSVKAPIYYAVIMNRRHSSDQLNVLRETWTQDIAWQRVSYFIPLEEDGHHQVQAVEGATEEEWDEDVHYGEIQNRDKDDVDVVELENRHSDFYVDVLSYVCRAKLNETKWFLFAGDDVYVKSRDLEEHLQHYENIPSFQYLGRPASVNNNRRGPAIRECLTGPGTVLSHSAMVELCSKIDTCRESTGEGVARCIAQQLGQECNGLEKEEERFLQVDSDVSGSIIEKANAHKLDAALTLHPVTDAKMMYNIHQSVVGKELNTTQHEMHSLKWALDRMTELLPHSGRGLKSSYRQHVDVISTDDIVSWKLVNHDLLLSDEENTPTREVPGVWRLELQAMMDKAVQYLNVKDDSRHIYKRIVNTYWRVDPLSAIHYIIDFESSRPDQAEDSSASRMTRHRITFSRSLNSPETSHLQSPVSVHVTIVVCFTSSHTERLQQFMRRLETVLDHDQRLNLVAVQMKSAAEKQKPRRSQNVVDAKSILSLYRTKYPSASFTVLDSPALLSRSHAVAMVLRESRPSDLLFLADLDFAFDEGFLDRCRNLPLQGQQVYFPIVFSEADPSLLASLNHSLMEGSVSQHSGHWLVTLYDAACVYAADLLTLNTQSDLKGMLNEVDMVEVYRVLLEKAYEVIRAPDKQLKRVYDSERTCDFDLVGLTHDESCKVKGDSQEQAYLKTQLSALLFDHEGENSQNKY